MALLIIFSLAACLLLAPLYVVYKPPTALIRYFQHRWPDVLWHVETTKKVVALTIDDAPSSHTREIVQVLNANNATATFFVVGSQASGQEEVLAELLKNGHELANHAMHDEASKFLSNAELLHQIEAVHTQIEHAYRMANARHSEHRFFRPGSGFFSTRMRQTLSKVDYQIVLGSIYPHDAQIPYWKINAHHILSMLRPGAIIICHDRRSWTVPMLRTVLPEMKRRGYEITTVSELLKQSAR
ncbi:hypothetical protein LTR05_006414 [Lithohypha guttulata]|uniref:chitin deacetylase n=1 Tax=Lithohypha guttulata TaxID=1690604 RepID=A0AAN7SYT0_9EURO|nr:hypothetical protein LTR05_006414 [Lithohypha guttulata]